MQTVLADGVNGLMTGDLRGAQLAAAGRVHHQIRRARKRQIVISERTMHPHPTLSGVRKVVSL